MATPKLKTIDIPTLKKVHPHDLSNRKYWTIKKIFQYKFFELDEEGRYSLVKEVKKRAIGEERLMNRYLDAMGEMRFLSKERVAANREHYECCTEDARCTYEGVEGYWVTQNEVYWCNASIKFHEIGIGYMMEYLSKRDILNEARAVATTAIVGKHFLDAKPEQNQQAYLKHIRETMQAMMQHQGLSLRRAILLTRHFIQEHI